MVDKRKVGGGGFGKAWANPVKRKEMMATAKRKDRGAGRKPGTSPGYTQATMAQLWTELAVEAEEVIKEMEAQGIVVPVVVVEEELLDNDSMMAREALKQAIAIMRSPVATKTRLDAASKILEYTKTKPASTVNSNIAPAESFLEMLASKG